MSLAKAIRKPRYSNTEQVLKRSILDWLQRQPECLPLMYPANKPARQSDGSYRAYKSPYMPPGVSDILACWKGRYVAIEVKRPAGEKPLLGGVRQAKGVLSEFQKVFLERVHRAKGIALVAYSLQDVIDALKHEIDNVTPKKDTSNET